jgi:hypothetical protein
MKFTILKIQRRPWPFSISYPYDVSLMLENGQTLTVTSWKPEESTFLYHLKLEIERKLRKRTEENTNRAELIESFIGKTFESKEL